LFSISYGGLSILILSLSLLGIYNGIVEHIHAMGDTIVTSTLSSNDLKILFSTLINTLHQKHASWIDMIFLLSTLLLAIGATIYTIVCPSRVKEFTRDYWIDRAGLSLLIYLGESWEKPILRVACATGYLIGGTIAGILLIYKFGRYVAYLYGHVLQ
jgi:hypothetical protein